MDRKELKRDDENRERSRPDSISRRRRGWDWKIAATWFVIVISILSGVFYVGKMDARIEANGAQLSKLSTDFKTISDRVDRLVERRTSAPEFVSRQPVGEVKVPEVSDVFANGKLASGYDMGVNTSGGLTGWVEVRNGNLCMDYPIGQRWGAVFITVGPPTQLNRPGIDVGQFRALSIEVRGTKGDESVWVGLKDNSDSDNGTETKIQLDNLTQDWQTRKIELSRFKTADLGRIYVATEFVFETESQSICVRKIEFIH